MPTLRKWGFLLSDYKTNRVFYTGVTNNLVKRIWQHRQKVVSSFTSKYNVEKLVYCEIFDSPLEAIKREKQIKAGSRGKKLKLNISINPHFEDLYLRITK
ncbi:hypothetical protein A3B51_01010 [Candidatus Curtissbacteria bacterium RIFCSPLOWO2_01_FULL_41_18]|uniref:GIY-YIG domain-containing protein n=1 Tax=Candidatus Curtissbacteria bacterium RIFCSPLOWO2_01_FULL_41_18 TaxID=1797727 RepID=A0A1F5HN56_9BACT|nr:MAG: hypothetical protein A3B51_01010 [Candidatus Curtissbacteria bacterium RIFCSPLOWO2_01_FULL_41_18]